MTDLKELDRILADRTRKEPKNDGTLRMYLVLNGDDAKLIKSALAAIGVNGDYASFLRVSVKNEIKRRVAEKIQKMEA